MKPSDRKRLYADVSTAQDQFSLEVVRSGSQFAITRRANRHGGLTDEQRQYKADQQLDLAVAALRQLGWKCTNITTKGEAKTFLVGAA